MKWGLLGASRILERSLLPAMRAAGHQPVALAARDGDRARSLATAWDIPAGCTYDDLLARTDVDAIYISTVNDAHLPWIVRALGAGRDVLCEKPLTLGPREVLAVQAAEAAGGRRVMEAFVYGFHPQIADLLATVRDGTLGQVMDVDARFANVLRNPDDYRWHAVHGGGALLDLGTYCVSLIRDVMGREPDRVTGLATRAPGRAGSVVDVDVGFAGTLAFGDALATFGCTLLGGRSQGLRLIGTTGTMEVPVPFSSRNRALTTTVNGTERHWAPTDPYAAMVTHFARAMAGEEPLRHGSDEAMRQARVLQALVDAAGAMGGISHPSAPST